MKKYTIYGEEFFPKFSFPIKGKFKKTDLIPLDLSDQNDELDESITKSVKSFQDHIFRKISSAQAKGAYGGYGERRSLYRRSQVFQTIEKWRNVHLGLDIWFPAGTAVCAPMPGRIHSFQNTSEKGDYGPTIILEHHIGNEKIYSLYGHLSLRSLEGIEIGQMILRGEIFAHLGHPDENVDWPPHLHFQLIYDIQNKTGDYPGVCHADEREFYLKNCPNPSDFFNGFDGIID